MASPKQQTYIKALVEDLKVQLGAPDVAEEPKRRGSDDAARREASWVTGAEPLLSPGYWYYSRPDVMSAAKTVAAIVAADTIRAATVWGCSRRRFLRDGLVPV